MEGRKRIYPAQTPKIRWMKSLLLLATALVVLSGIASRKGEIGFVLESVPEEEEIALDEAFDETMAEITLDLPKTIWYALQVGVFESEESAMQASDVYRKRGAAGYMWQDGRWRVLAAAYPDKESAQLVRSQLRDDHNIDSYLYEIDFPAVSMRLTGMKGQLEILQASFTHASELARQLQELSVSLDRQEISASEVAQRLEALSQQIGIVALRLEQRFPKPFHPTVSAMMACFERYMQFAGAFPSHESAVSMGVRLKYQTFTTLEDIQKVYQTLRKT